MKRVILLLLFPLLTMADPGAATRYLMNEPASLLDVGILRIEQYIETRRVDLVERYAELTKNSNVFVTTMADYSFDDDKVHIHFFVGANSGDQAQEGCRKLIADLRAEMTTLVVAAFAHSGYTKNQPAENFVDEIVQRTDIYCHVRDLNASKDVLTAIANLADGKVAITEGYKE